MTAREYLRFIQVSAFRSSGLPLRTLQSEYEYVQGSIDFVARQAHEMGFSTDEVVNVVLDWIRSHPAAAEMPTAHEHSAMYYLLRDLQEQVLAAARRLGHNIPAPLCGTCPIGQVNARALYFEDQILVLFDWGVFGFLDLMAAVVCTAFPFRQVGDELELPYSPELIHRHVESNRAARELFTALFRAYLLDGNPHIEIPVVLTPEQHAMRRRLTRGAELFLMCHEFAHIILGHLPKSDCVKSAIGDEPVREVWPSWEQEFAADTTGLMLALTVEWENQLLTAILGGPFFLWCAHVLDMAHTLIGGGDEREPTMNGSHPPGALRHKLMESALDGLPKHIASGKLLSRIACETMQALWNVERENVRAHTVGINSLAPVWRSRQERTFGTLDLKVPGLN